MIERLTDEEFNQFAEQHQDNMFFQSSYWGDLKTYTGWEKHLIGIKENNNIIAATLILGKQIPILRKKMFYAPRGFLIDYHNFELVKRFTVEMKKYLKKQKGIFFKINPNIPYQERDVDGQVVEMKENNHAVLTYLESLGYEHNGFTIHYGKDLEPRWISVLDLENKTEEEVFGQFRSSHRRKIKKSLGGWLSLEQVTSDDPEKFDIYKKIMTHTGDRRGFIDRAEDYYKKMYDAFAKDKQIQIVLVKLDLEKYNNHLIAEQDQITQKLENMSIKKENEKKVLENQLETIQKNIEEITETIQKEGKSIYITAGLFMLFGPQLTYLFGGSYDKYMKYFGAYYMQWKMIQYAIEHHYKAYNFYGITGEFNEDSPMYGLFDFKRGFHATVVELIGEFTYVISRPYYFIYNQMFSVYKKIKKWRVKK